MEYIETKEQYQSLINGVCPGCGGEITSIKTIDNADNPAFCRVCKKCDRFTWGIEEIYFKIARKCVKEKKLIPYSSIKIDDVNEEYYLQTQTCKASDIVKYIISIYKEKKWKEDTGKND